MVFLVSRLELIMKVVGVLLVHCASQLYQNLCNIGKIEYWSEDFDNFIIQLLPS